VIASAVGEIVACNRQQLAVGAETMVCVRPEFIKIVATGAAPARNAFRAKVESLVFVGEAYEGEIRIGKTLLTMTVEPTVRITEGDEIVVSFQPDHCFLLTP